MIIRGFMIFLSLAFCRKGRLIFLSLIEVVILPPLVFDIFAALCRSACFILVRSAQFFELYRHFKCLATCHLQGYNHVDMIFLLYALTYFGKGFAHLLFF